MPRIISSTTLRNQYGEVSRDAHQNPEPIYVTKNGAGDLAVMSIEAYEVLARKAELKEKLAQGHADIAAGRVIPAEDGLAMLRKEFSR